MIWFCFSFDCCINYDEVEPMKVSPFYLKDDDQHDEYAAAAADDDDRSFLNQFLTGNVSCVCVLVHSKAKHLHIR
jgi:hypothetical protein